MHKEKNDVLSDEQIARNQADKKLIQTSARNPLLEVLLHYFDWEELRTLCFQLGIDYDNLAGRTKVAQARELILHVQRHNQLRQLVNTVIEQRPQTSILLADIPLDRMYIPPNQWENWWKHFRRLSPILQLGLGFLILLTLALLSLSIYSWVRETPIASRAELDVRPATEGENLILISAFRGSGGLLPEQRIEAWFQEARLRYPDLNLRIQLVRKEIIDNATQAEAWGRQHKAQLVIWGWYDDLAVEIKMALPPTEDILGPYQLPPIRRAQENWQEKNLDQLMREQIELGGPIALGWVALANGMQTRAIEIWSDLIVQTENLPLENKRSLHLDELFAVRGALSSDKSITQNDYAEALIINPQNLLALYNRAVSKYDANDYISAAIEAQKIIDLVPSPPPLWLGAALNVAAAARTELGDLDIAMHLAERAVAIDAANVQSWRTLNDIYLRQKQWIKSIDVAKQAIQLDSDNAIPYFNLGRAYLHTGQIQNAQHSYQDGAQKARTSHQLQIIPAALAELTQDMTDYPELKTDIEPLITFLKNSMKAD